MFINGHWLQEEAMAHLRTLLLYTNGETEANHMNAQPRYLVPPEYVRLLLLHNLLGIMPLESESQTCMFWRAHTVKHTIYGCRIHSLAFIQPFLYEVSELVTLTVNSFECPRKTPNILTSTLKMDGGYVF